MRTYIHFYWERTKCFRVCAYIRWLDIYMGWCKNSGCATNHCYAQLLLLLSLSWLSAVENLCPFNEDTHYSLFYTESVVVKMGPGCVLKLKVNPQLPLTCLCNALRPYQNLLLLRSPNPKVLPRNKLILGTSDTGFCSKPITSFQQCQLIKPTNKKIPM